MAFASRTDHHEVKGAGTKLLDRALPIFLLAFAAPVLLGVAVSAVRLAATAHPSADFGVTVNADARALSLGSPLYQDPDKGYTGILYTPLAPTIVSVLYRLGAWEGWSLMLALLASLAVGAGVGRVAYAPRRRVGGDRARAAAEAVGIGALAWLLVSCIRLNGIYDGRVDQVAWAFALGGLVALPAASRGSRGAAALCLLGLSAAFWTKQNAIAASVAAAVWVLASVGLGRVTRRWALGFCGALAGLNLAILGTLNGLTGGWEWELNFAVPAAQPLGDLNSPFPENLPRFFWDLFPSVVLAVVFAGMPWLALAVRSGAPARAARAAGREATDVLTGARAAVAGRDWALLTAPVLVLVAGAAYYRFVGEALNLYFLREPLPGAKLSRFVDDIALPGVTLAVLSAGALAAGVVVRTRLREGGSRHSYLQVLVRHRNRRTKTSTDGELAGVLLTSVLVGVLLAVYFRQKIGTDDNLYIGIAWGLVMLGALGYRRACRMPATGGVASATVIVLFVAMLVGSPLPDPENGLWFPSPSGNPSHESDERLVAFLPTYGLLPAREWPETPPELRDYARGHTVYDGASALGAASDGGLYPPYDNWSGLLAGGVQPGYLVRAFLDRRFDAVTTFDTAERKEGFASGNGTWEENYQWKLNRVIEARYGSSPAAPAGLVERRPGPERAAWMRECFGPFALRGAALRINRGGGFWCASPRARDELTLVDTHAPYSDLRTTESVGSMTGAITARLAGKGEFKMSVEPEDGPPWTLVGRSRTPRLNAIRLSIVSAGATTAGAVVRLDGGRGVRLLLSGPPEGGPPLASAAGGSARVKVPELGGGAVVRFGATKGSGAVFDLRGLRLHE